MCFLELIFKLGLNVVLLMCLTLFFFSFENIRTDQAITVQKATVQMKFVRKMYYYFYHKQHSYTIIFCHSFCFLSCFILSGAALLVEAANMGDPDAQYELGCRLRVEVRFS